MYGKNRPYTDHLFSVANRALVAVNQFYPANRETIATIGLLHDVVEDTDVTEDDLREMYPDVVTDAVMLLTKDESLSYDENIQRIIDSGNTYAMIVKYCDNTDNLENSIRSYLNGRTANQVEKAGLRMAKYMRSMAKLEKALDKKEWV